MAIIAALFLLTARAPWKEQEMLEGSARVVDGDTILLAATRIRLAGIDAPELAQTCENSVGEYACGREARTALNQLVAGRRVTCTSSGSDRYGRMLALCRVGDTDLNRTMVEQGWAVAYGDYERTEADARRARRGLWAGAFDQPQEWRRLHGQLDETGDRGFVARLFDFWHRSDYPNDD